MSKNISRKEFIKLSTSLPLLGGIKHFQRAAEYGLLDKDKKNILIIVFDTLSATNMSLYGYPRKTTPILESLLENATVYHNHYAGGNWTTPGTASILTGVYPWSHRAIRQAASIHPFFNDRNLFSLFNEHYKVSYTHNPTADKHLRQFRNNFNFYKPVNDLYLRKNLTDTLLINDFDVAFFTREKLLHAVGDPQPGDIFALVRDDLDGQFPCLLRDPQQRPARHPGKCQI